jgi:hypothetical protein
LGGPAAAQLEEPADHALGRSKGGFGTKVHLLCESHGVPLGIYVTPGQRHESKFFETVIERVLLRRRPGQRYWPKKLAGDKGYSYAHSAPLARVARDKITWLRHLWQLGNVPRSPRRAWHGCLDAF